MTGFLGELIDRYADAKARVSAIKAEYDAERAALEAKYNEAFAVAKEEYLALETLLRIEERKSGQELVLPTKSEPRLPLAEFFITALHAHGRMSKDDLRDHAERAGYFETGDSGGRATHATLLNLSRVGRIVESDPGVYEHLLAAVGNGDSAGKGPTLF